MPSEGDKASYLSKLNFVPLHIQISKLIIILEHSLDQLFCWKTYSMKEYKP